MTAPLSAERVEELREYALDQNLPPDFMDLCDDYSSLREENERLTYLHNLDHSLADRWLARAEKAKAELDMKKAIIKDIQSALGCGDEWPFTAATRLKAELLSAQMTNAKNGAVIIEQMAELEKQRPLVEAANGAIYEEDGIFRCGMETGQAILRAALALRGKK